MLLEARIDNILPHMDEIILYMIMRTQDRDEVVALETCEFWLVLADQTFCYEVLKSHINSLVPVLVRCMKYSELDIIVLKGDVDEDQNVPDKQEDIRPRFHKVNRMHNQAGQKKEEGATVSGMSSDDQSMNVVEEFDGSDDDDKDGDVSDWNLSMCLFILFIFK